MESLEGRRLLGVALLFVGIAMTLGGCGAGCIVLSQVHPQSPEVLTEGSANSSIPFRHHRAAGAGYTLYLHVTVDAAKTVPKSKGSQYLDPVEYELDLSRGSPAKRSGRLDDQLLEPASGGTASGLWSVAAVEADSSGVIEGSLVARPKAAAHGIRRIGLQLQPEASGLGLAIGLIGIAVLGMVVWPVGIALLISKRAERNSDYALRPLQVHEAKQQSSRANKAGSE